MHLYSPHYACTCMQAAAPVSSASTAPTQPVDAGCAGSSQCSREEIKRSLIQAVKGSRAASDAGTRAGSAAGGSGGGGGDSQMQPAAAAGGPGGQQQQQGGGSSGSQDLLEEILKGVDACTRYCAGTLCHGVSYWQFTVVHMS